MSPSTVVRRAVAACSTLTVPCALSKVTSPSGPSVVKTALAAFAWTADPAGSWTVTSTAPVLPRTRLAAGAVTRSTPSL